METEELNKGIEQKRKLGPISTFALRSNIGILCVLAISVLFKMPLFIIFLAIPFAMNIGVFKGNQKQSFIKFTLWLNQLSLFLWFVIVLVMLFGKGAKVDFIIAFILFALFALYCSFISWLSNKQIKTNYIKNT